VPSCLQSDGLTEQAVGPPGYEVRRSGLDAAATTRAGIGFHRGSGAVRPHDPCPIAFPLGSLTTERALNIERHVFPAAART
jgi:hypothetical protein